MILLLFLLADPCFSKCCQSIAWRNSTTNASVKQAKNTYAPIFYAKRGSRGSLVHVYSMGGNFFMPNILLKTKPIKPSPLSTTIFISVPLSKSLTPLFALSASQGDSHGDQYNCSDEQHQTGRTDACCYHAESERDGYHARKSSILADIRNTEF